MKKVLLVAYGSGHIQMVVPVAQALQAHGLAQPVVLALTTAAPVAHAAGLETVQFKDFVTPGDAAALAHGRRLMQGLAGPVADPDETAAYLGLSYADLELAVGPEAAAADYQRRGRQAFLPVPTLTRVLRQLAPDLVLATNAPRAERAAVLAARALGIPAICLVDLFAIDEVQWIGAPDYADRVCVLNASVRDFLVAAGRREEQITITGNPAFDAINRPEVLVQGQDLRASQGWGAKKVLLWPTQVEPATHPFDGRPGRPQLPGAALAQLVQWVQARSDTVLVVRTRAGEAPPALPNDPRVVLTDQRWPLAPLLHATDVVVTLTSTVGLEGHLAGCRLVQVTGSVFDQAMPLARYGIADQAVPLQGLNPALDHWVAQPRGPAQNTVSATQQVLSVVAAFL
ncbi:UDP-glycosyltransferase [Hydrogenophaga sp.]|uniref:UDP-glycosyltransferase n=1 Tax=Hydrogenophaga sp. TaxID=1904254 RepID=UPI0035632CA9